MTGTGTSGNPFVVSVNAVDCSQVRPCISAGNGAAYNSASGIVSARPSTDAGNLVEFGTDGGLYATTDCAQVRACLSEGDGIDYDPVTGVVSARPSTDVGNNLIFGGDGGLYVPTGAATVSTGCGALGDGSAGNPVRANVGAWPYACDAEDNGGVVHCGADGVLRGEPRGRAAMTSQFFDQDFPNTAVPAARNQLAAHFEGMFTNPDPCRSALIVVSRELEVTFNLPAGAGAEQGFDGPDETVFHRNTGASAENGFHVQSTKVLPGGTAPAGGTVTVGFDALVGLGTAGAVYTHIQAIIRVLFITA